jgi:hypothetical protein
VQTLCLFSLSRWKYYRTRYSAGDSGRSSPFFGPLHTYPGTQVCLCQHTDHQGFMIPAFPLTHPGKNSVLLKTFFDYGGKKKKGAKRPTLAWEVVLEARSFFRESVGVQMWCPCNTNYRITTLLASTGTLSSSSYPRILLVVKLEL